jgi:purine-binding chemotaxis protein CheW
MINPLTTEMNSGAIEFLTFLLNEEIYGLDILNVQEIHGYDQITQIGVDFNDEEGHLNLRGKNIPVIDLRRPLHDEVSETIDMTNVIIAKAKQTTFGLVVDGVSDVISITQNQIYRDSAVHASIDRKYISGLLHIDENIVMLIDIEKLMQC